MQHATTKFTKNDLAKYPFLKETAKYIQKLSLKIEDLTDPGFAEILKRAEERVEEAILSTLVSRNLQNLEVEISSFPVATLLAVATENSFIKKRYALAEAKEASNDMEQEPKEKILAIAQNFGWKLSINQNPAIPFEFVLYFTDYVRNTTNLRDKKWKLINRLLTAGNVYMTHNEAARLLQEEIRKHIEKRLEIEELPKLPPEIIEIANRIKQLSIEKIGKTEMEGFPKEIVQPAFPPCITALYEAAASGRHLSHIGRFTLTAFLINIGMTPEKVIELFRSFSDYSERMTRYQVEHIAGEKGSRTRYTPPRCDTLKTHSVCLNPDETCKNLHHPLTYYRIKLKKTK
jgi:DNA primase large subunit